MSSVELLQAAARRAAPPICGDCPGAAGRLRRRPIAFRNAIAAARSHYSRSTIS
ncbi:hypothetical protein HY988_07405 [Candidatus Micrarchaeota archaeon]|nr:hypothetical protein [Candidatus Micrarchaeota archaeon]